MRHQRNGIRSGSREKVGADIARQLYCGSREVRGLAWYRHPLEFGDYHYAF
jgi:hypothetical protein